MTHSVSGYGVDVLVSKPSAFGGLLTGCAKNLKNLRITRGSQAHARNKFGGR
jgi:hypothetical protein